VPLVRQKLHLSSCPDFRAQLYPQDLDELTGFIAGAKAQSNNIRIDPGNQLAWEAYSLGTPVLAPPGSPPLATSQRNGSTLWVRQSSLGALNYTFVFYSHING
jgi:hypothetical protein